MELNFVKKLPVVLKQNSPKIAIGVGIALSVGAVVVTAVQTSKLDKTMDDIHEKVEGAKECYPEKGKERAKALTKSYAYGFYKLSKLYFPVVTIEGLSVASILYGYHKLDGRYLTAIAAMTSIDESFRRYRNRVIDEYGSDVDYRFRNDIYEEKVTEVGEDGKKHKVKADILAEDANTWDAVVYNPLTAPSSYVKGNRMANLDHIRIMEKHANDMLQIDGFVLVNDILDWFGMDRDTLGGYKGWLNKDEYGDLCEGDGYIHFNVREVSDKSVDHDDNPTFIIDMNVDGIILDKINYGKRRIAKREQLAQESM